MGDQVAIMAGGRLQCCGSPAWLKRTLGPGYKLVVDLDAGPQDETRGAATRRAAEAIAELLRAKVPGAALLERETAGPNKLAFLLPFGGAAAYEACLAELEAKAAHLGVTDYGISIASLEEVHSPTSERERERERESLPGDTMVRRRTYTCARAHTINRSIDRKIFE